MTAGKLINLKVFSKFIKSGNLGGLLLFLMVILSLLLANIGFANEIQSILDTKLGFENEAVQLNYSVAMWINDGLMAVFFLLVGLEIKREIVEGELSTPKKAILPVIAAIGGAAVPALIYLFFNGGTATSGGWGIPMATDIAFALAVISLLDKRIPASLKIFLAALAIVDDLIAILVIAVFYSDGIQLFYLGAAAVGLILLIVLNRTNVTNIIWYLIPGVFIWYFIHHSGIHATIAGVLVAMTLPTNDSDIESPLEKLEHALLKPVNLFIVPIFAFANTSITFQSEMIDGLVEPLGLGITLGLLFGKPVGILLASFICSKLSIGQLPQNSNMVHMTGLGFLAAIGFTMSIFISILSFNDVSFVQEAKLSVLISSLMAGIIGFVILRSTAKSISVVNESGEHQY